MLCFRDKTSNILREHHANIQFGDEKTQIIKTALKIICNDIATIDLDPKSYPDSNSILIIEEAVFVPLYLGVRLSVSQLMELGYQPL